MNPLFYPSNTKTRESKSGLEKHRKIMHYSDAPSSEAIKDNIPDSWYYNNNNANKIWDSLEVDPVVKFEPSKSTDSPFAQIDASANRIRQMITSYEISDQELLVNLMSILEQDDEFFGSYQDDDALFEAKLRLGSMINDHSGNSEAQEKMLSSLRKWFASLSKKSQVEGDGDLKNIKDTYNVDVNQLAEMINDSFETREVNSEQIQLLHRSVVDNLTRQIRDMRRKITEQEETIEELNKTIEAQKNFRKRQMQNLKKDEMDIMNYQRSICEKDARITDLKSTINEIAVESKSTDRPNPPTPPEEDPVRPDEEIAYSLEKDFEFDTRIRSMNNTISSLKQELTEASMQLRIEKQSGFALENKYQLLDRTKKSIEQTLLSTNERYALLEKKLKDKTEELEKMQKNFESSAVAEAISVTKKEYEEKIHDILDANRANVSKAVENVEKRYKKQIAELMKAVEAGEAKTAIDELNNQHIHEIEIIKKECKDEIDNLKVMHGNRLNLLTRHYEAKIAQLLNDQKKIQESIEKDRDIHVEEKRIEIEEDFSRKMIDYQDKAATDLSDLKSRFEGKVNKLEEKLRIIESERDLLKGIIEENNLYDELPENFNETSADFNGDEDDVLADSIIQMKNREIEKSASEKYNAFLKAQRYSIEDYKNWEIEKLNNSFRTELNENLANLRQEVMENLCQLRTILTSNTDEKKNANDLDNTIIKTLKIVQNNDSKMMDTLNKQLIPLNEVESRLSECNEKINDLSGENEFLRFTLQQLNNGKELIGDNNEDLVRAMRTSLSAQASQMSQTLREYDDLKARIEYYEQKEKNVELSDQLVQTGNELKSVFSPASFVIYSRNETEELRDDEIILRDNLNRPRARRSLNKKIKNDEQNSESEDEEQIEPVRFDDMATQTDLIQITKKKVKKVKNQSAKSETESPSVAESSINSGKPQTPNNESDKKEVINESQKETEKIETKKQINDEKQIDNEKQIDEKQQIETNINKINDNNNKQEEKQSIINSPKNEIKNVDTNENKEEIINDQNNNSKDEDNEYEYEYEDNYPEIRLTKLNLVQQNCIFQILPTGATSESSTYSIECPNCHQNVSFDPQISEVSSTIDPVVECPNCHNSVTIDREKYPIMFHDDNFKANKSLPLTPEEKSHIAAMEESIHKQVQDLIKMKQKIRTEQNNQNDDSHFRNDLSTSLPTVILNIPSQEQKSEKINKSENDSSVDLKVSHESLSIEIPAFSIEIISRKMSPRNKSAPSLSSRSFTNKFEQNEMLSPSQENQISSAEKNIDNEISKLIEYKQEILSKRNSQKDSDDENENNSQNSTKPATTVSNSRKLKLEEMPPSQGNNKPVIENIATDLQMSDFQLQRTLKNSTNQNQNQNQNETKTGSLTIQSSSSHFFPLNKTELKISNSVFNEFKMSQKSDIINDSKVNDYVKSLANQTVSEIDNSIENNPNEPIKKLETIEKAVLTLSNLNAFSISDENAVLASNILQKAQSLKDIDPTQIPTDEVEEVVQSARKLIVSLCQETELDKVTIKPLSKEAGGIFTDDIEKLRTENLKYQNEIIILKEMQAKLKEEVEDLNGSTKELKLKHEEVIFSLQKIVENILKSMKEGDGKLNSSSLKSLKDQAQYLIGSIKEKENLETDNKEINQLLKERDVEIISLNHMIQNKEGQIEELSSKLAELTAHIEKADLKSEGQKFSIESLEKLDKENKRVIDSMSETIFKMKDASDELQKKLDQLELDNEQLQNKIIMKESENPISYSYISPFIIFDTDLEFDIPAKGFTLVPGKNQYDQISSQNQHQNSDQKEENATEKIRVKYNQTGKNNQNLPISGAPKLIVPKTAHSRSRLGSNSRSASTSSSKVQSNFGKTATNDEPDYVDYCPVHAEDRKSFMYIRQVKPTDNKGSLGGARSHLDRNPINGNVVLQKTVTNLNKRIFSLQNILQVKAHEIIKLRDQKNESRQNLYKMTIQYQKSQRELIRAKTTSLLCQEKLEKALKIIEERDLEIKELRDLIRQLRTAAAQPALIHQVMSNIAEDNSNLAAMRAFRRRTTLNEIAEASEISPMLKRFAQRQIIVVKNWEKRRQDLIRQQRNHLLSVLAGMSLIATPSRKLKSELKKDGIDDDIMKKISTPKKTVTVTSLQSKKKDKMIQPKRKNSSRKQENDINDQSEFDSSWRNANADPQQIPPGMTEGVVAQPL